MGCNTQRIDLHIHSTASDGSLTPQEIAELALREGIRAIALTDHDSMEGTKQLLETGLPEGVELLSGVEVSAAPPPAGTRKGSLHILGYGMDVADAALHRILESQQAARTSRIPKILARLNEEGIAVAASDVESIARNRVISRPHIAQWLVARGFAEDLDQAFDRYLGKGCPAYVGKSRVPADEAIARIREAGGIAVLAHPGLVPVPDSGGYDRLLIELMSMGLQGIEVYYPEHSEKEQAFFERMAERLGLLMTGGSDFHGDLNSKVRLGVGTGNLHVPYRLYKNMVDKLNPTAA